VYRHVLQCWQDKAARGAAKWQSLAKALCFCKQQLLTKALVGWAEGIQQQQEARAAAAAAFQEVGKRLELPGAAAALQAWLQAAQLQAERRRLLDTAAAARNQLRRRQVRLGVLLLASTFTKAHRTLVPEDCCLSHVAGVWPDHKD
jgi:hypothetical protein